MPQISKAKLDKKLEIELEITLELILAKVNSTKDMSLLLSSLITPTEKVMLAKRLGAILLLKEGTSKKDVSRSLHLTMDTVAKLELISEARGEGFNIAIKTLQKEKTYEKIKQELFKLAGYSIRAAGGYVKPTIT